MHLPQFSLCLGFIFISFCDPYICICVGGVHFKNYRLQRDGFVSKELIVQVWESEFVPKGQNISSTAMIWIFNPNGDIGNPWDL